MLRADCEPATRMQSPLSNSAVPSHSCLNLLLYVFISIYTADLGTCTVADRDEFGEFKARSTPTPVTKKNEKREVLRNLSGNSIVIRHCIYTTVTVSATILCIYTIVSRSEYRASRFRWYARISLAARETLGRNNRSKFNFSLQPPLFFLFFTSPAPLCSSVSLLNN